MTPQAPIHLGHGKVAVFAYGSLRWSLRDLEPHLVRRFPAPSPFPVEYMRLAASRGYAPVLVPHESGGRVAGEFLVLDVSADEEGAAMARRLTAAAERASDLDLIVRVDVPGFYAVFHASMPVNLRQPSAEFLAKKAIESVARCPEHERDRNGIRYLAENLKAGIVTPMSPAYEAAVLSLTSAKDLAQAERHTTERLATE